MMPRNIIQLIAVFIILTLVRAQNGAEQTINKTTSNQQMQINGESNQESQAIYLQQQKRREEYIESVKKTTQQNADSQKIGAIKQQQKKQFERKLAEQSKIAYQQYRKQQEDRQIKQEQERARLAQENTMTKIQQIQQKQNEQMQAQYNKLRNGPSRQFNEYSFNLESNSAEDFKISIPINQQIVFFVEIFQSKNGVFSPPTDVQNEQPLWIYIFQNNVKIIYQKQMYFRTFGSINGQANTTYLFRFVNHGSQRLIFFRPMVILQNTHVYDLITDEDVADHGVRLRNVKNQLYQKLNQLNIKFMLQNQNKKRLMTGISHYYFYNIFEIVLIALLCILQVEFVQKLLSSTSVI